jgi:hypothetical protein
MEIDARMHARAHTHIHTHTRKVKYLNVENNTPEFCPNLPFIPQGHVL